MDSFVEYCRARGNAPATINIGIRTLKAAFSRAVQWDYIKKNPFAGYEAVRVHQAPPRFLPDAEAVQRVFSVIGDNTTYRLLFALMAYTGARRGEIARLQWADIGHDTILFRDRKNYQALRVPIVPQLRTILDGFAHRVGRVVPLTKGQISHGIKKYLRLAGYGDLRPHDLRHTFASQLIMAGVDLRTVQELLGHTTYQTTTMYAHLLQDHLRKAVEKLPY